MDALAVWEVVPLCYSNYFALKSYVAKPRGFFKYILPGYSQSNVLFTKIVPI